MDKIKANKAKIGLYFLIILLGFLCISPFFKFHLTPDSYWLINPNNRVYSSILIENGIMNSESGRPVSDMFIMYMNMIGLNMMYYQKFFNFLSVVIMLIATILLYKTCEELTNNKFKSIWITGFASFLIIFNAFSFELFVYNVMTSLSMQYILVICSVRILLKEINFRNIFISIILNSIGLCIYQGISPLFIALAMILLGYKYKDKPIVTNIKNYLLVGVIYAISCISNILVIKLGTVNRYEKISIVEAIKRIIKIQNTIWIDTYGFITKYLFLFIIITFLIILITYIVKEDKDKLWKMLMCVFGATIMTVIAAFIPYIFSTVAIVPRTILTISTIPWIILLFIGINYGNLNSIVRLIIGVIVGLYIFILINLSYRLTDSIVRVNEYDKLIAGKVMEIVEKYEESNNIKVTKLSYCYDTNYTWWIPNQPTINIDCLGRALTVSWSWKDVFYQYYGRSFELTSMDNEIYNQYFKDKDWNTFSEEQIVCAGDTLYMISY